LLRITIHHENGIVLPVLLVNLFFEFGCFLCSQILLVSSISMVLLPKVPISSLLLNQQFKS